MTEIERPFIDKSERMPNLNLFDLFRHFNPLKPSHESSDKSSRAYSRDVTYSPFFIPNYRDSIHTDDHDAAGFNCGRDPYAAALMKVQYMNRQVKIWEMIALSEGSNMASMSLRKLYEHVSALIKNIEDDYDCEDRLGIAIPQSTTNITRSSSISEGYDMSKRVARRSRRGSRASNMKSLNRTIGKFTLALSLTHAFSHN
jgi:hypothetical protein